MNNYSIDYRKILGIDLAIDALILSQSPQTRVDVQVQTIDEAVKQNYDNDLNVYQYFIDRKLFFTHQNLISEFQSIRDNASIKITFILTIKFS